MKYQQNNLDIECLLNKSSIVYENTFFSIKDYDSYRLLTFHNRIIQTVINKHRANELPFILNQAMLAALIFMPSPKNICLIGTGGGASARFLHAIDPAIKGIALENNEQIINVAKTYFDFPSKNWDIIYADAQYYQFTQRQDLIIIDFDEAEVSPSWLVTEQYLNKLKLALGNHGIIIFNIIFETKQKFISYLSQIRIVFPKKVLCFQVDGLNNILVYAFKSKPEKTFLNEIPLSIHNLSQKWGIDFNTYYLQMLRDNPKNSGIF